MKNLSLRRKFLLAFLLVALVPLSMLAAINYRTTRNTLEDTANQSLFAVASQSAASLDSFIEATLRNTGTEAHLPTIVTYMQLAADERAGSTIEMDIENLLDVLSRKNSHISSYALLDTQGHVVYDTLQDNIGADESAESWVVFFDGESLGVTDSPSVDGRTLHGVRLQNHDIYVSPVERSSFTNKASIYFSSPIHNIDGSYFGLLRVRYRADVLQALLVEKNDQAGERSFGVLFDEYNIHLAHGLEPDVNFIPIAPMPSDVVSKLIASKRLPDLPDIQLFPMQLDDLASRLDQSDTNHFFEAEGITLGDSVNQVAVANLQTMPWKIAFFQSQESFLSPIQAQARQAGILALFIVLGVAVFAAWMTQRLTSPIRQLTQVAQQVSSGNLLARAKVASQDELGMLSAAFNSMTGQLQESFDTLEKRVVERTRALDASNAELQEQRDFAQQVLSSMGQGLIVLDAVGKINYVNPMFEALSGYRASELHGTQGQRYFHSDTDPTFEGVRQAIMGQQDLNTEMCLRRPNGELIWVLVAIAARMREGKVRGAIGVVTDLTDIKASERELAHARDKALEASRLKSEFLATMSHEIRTPMNGIIGMSEFLLETNLDAEQLQYATVVRSGADSLLTIINDILDFSKVEAGKMVIDSTDFDLHQLAQQTIDLIQPTAVQKQLPLALKIGPQTPRFLHGDAGRVKQVLTNLVNNAVKFTEQGHVTVQIQESAQTDEAVEILFCIIDTGIGISETVLETLFEPFVQADGSITRKHEGTGLGLAISKRLVALMGGSLDVESAENEGSTFRFTIPFTAAKEPAALAAAVPARAKPTPVVIAPVDKNAPTRVLVVEDNRVNQLVVRKQLEKLNCTVEIAANGQEALDLLFVQGKQYAFVLMDIHMPIMDGFTATSEIRKREQATGVHRPIIALTANAIKGDLERCLDAGMDDYISKPVRATDLKEKVNRWRRASTTG